MANLVKKGWLAGASPIWETGVRRRQQRQPAIRRATMAYLRLFKQGPCWIPSPTVPAAWSTNPATGKLPGRRQRSAVMISREILWKPWAASMIELHRRRLSVPSQEEHITIGVKKNKTSAAPKHEQQMASDEKRPEMRRAHSCKARAPRTCRSAAAIIGMPARSPPKHTGS